PKMSSASPPISPSRFASALKDLPLSTLHLKAAELRNSIAHLDYSNEQLKPFAESEPPDQDCVDAIRENEVVITRMTDRIRLLRVEVEGRGSSWLEFRSQEEVAEALARDGGSDEERLVNGTGTGTGTGMGEGEERSSAWADGTFQTGRIVNGEIRMDGNTGAEVVGNGTATANGTANVNGTGGRLDDEALSRAMEERMRGLEEDDDEEGMHL
ncbi:hypothetical protein LHYA1_G003003, partial [Lachnellula hyalina]